MKHKSVPFLFIIFVGLATSQCLPDIGGSGAEPASATRILDVKIHPNDTVATVDTLTFTCIIEDSTEMDRYYFEWFIDTGKVLNGNLVRREPNVVYRTEKETIRWIPKNVSEGRYPFTVYVHGKFPSQPVFEGYNIWINNNK